ncbi:hypothetical protein AB4Y32_30905 [Paraburkholderia phymatum]|uniref:Uncharacterized protein n=1 Tax=Paraburkholderia phymatum TaxID=148447 RepID=A0ACC6U9H1_9BURK
MRGVQEQVSAELSRYADDLAASPPAARAPRRIEIAAQPVESADLPLIAASEDLTRQVAGLRDWRIETTVTASTPEALRT